MDTKKSRSCYNLAIVKKGSRFDIVRYNNGFDKEPATILRGLCKDEVQSKFQRAIKLIASTMSQFSVFIRPYDKNQLVELVLMIEDSGITQEDIKIQNNGTIYFKMLGEDDSSVRNSVESLFRENNVDFDSSMITVSRGDALDTEKKVKAIMSEFGVVKQAEPVKKPTSNLTEEEQDTLDTLRMYPELVANPELKAKYDELIKKEGTTIQPSPSMEENDIDPINTVKTNINKAEVFLTSIQQKFTSGEALVQAMLDNGISVEEIKECYKNKPELLQKALQ